MPLEPPPWILNTQADIDACAEGLAQAGFTAIVWRRPTDDGIVRHMEIPMPSGRPQIAEPGKVVILLFGAPQVITYEQYQNSPFYEAP